jgi:hypothetical protein
MASIDRWSGGWWRARWRDPAGKTRSQVFERKTDAQRFLVRLEHARSEGAYVDPAAGRQTFEVFADEWAAAQSWKDTSREAWPYHRVRLVPILGSMPLAAVDRLALQRAQQALSARYARTTVTTTMSYAKAIMRAAHASGRIGRDPTSGLRRPKARAGEADGRVGPGDVPTREEALAILGATTSALPRGGCSRPRGHARR